MNINDNYVKLRPGHVFQMFKTGPGPNYNLEYVSSRYDQYKTGDAMSELRYNLIKSIIGNFKTICDYGYGNGNFLKYCTTKGHECFGYDISNYPLPRSCKRIYNQFAIEADVLTFFDSLEHIHESDLVSFLKSKKVKYLVISVPHYHESLGFEWFVDWKHRRPNEHFHHFDTHGLKSLLQESGYEVIYIGNDEDKIRLPSGNTTNILTMIGKNELYNT